MQAYVRLYSLFWFPIPVCRRDDMSICRCKRKPGKDGHLETAGHICNRPEKTFYIVQKITVWLPELKLKGQNFLNWSSFQVTTSEINPIIVKLVLEISKVLEPITMTSCIIKTETRGKTYHLLVTDPQGHGPCLRARLDHLQSTQEGVPYSQAIYWYLLEQYGCWVLLTGHGLDAAEWPQTLPLSQDHLLSLQIFNNVFVF